MNLKKVGRNAPCPCLSGAKFKKCCGRNLPETHGYMVDLKTPGGTSNPDAPEVGAKGGSTIVKVQMPLAGQGWVGELPAKVYSRDHDPRFEKLVPSSEVSEKMKGRLKVFFYATVQYGQLVLGDEAPGQGW